MEPANPLCPNATHKRGRKQPSTGHRYFLVDACLKTPRESRATNSRLTFGPYSEQPASFRASRVAPAQSVSGEPPVGFASERKDCYTIATGLTSKTQRWLSEIRACVNALRLRGVAQPGSAPALGAGGRPFKSARPDCASSSGGQSNGLLSRGSGVRIPSGAP
jgi:hypothetical protein